MTTAYIIIAIGVVGVLTIVVSVYLHKKHIHYHEDDLKQAINEYFDKLGEDTVSERAIWQMIQKRYNCSRKDTLYLVGLARKRGFITQVDGKVKRS